LQGRGVAEPDVLSMAIEVPTAWRPAGQNSSHPDEARVAAPPAQDAVPAVAAAIQSTVVDRARVALPPAATRNSKVGKWIDGRRVHHRKLASEIAPDRVMAAT
jgi:hypothetical protein